MIQRLTQQGPPSLYENDFTRNLTGNQSTSLTWHRMVLWRRSAVSRSCCHVSPTSISAIFHHNLRLQRTIHTALVTHFLLKNQTPPAIKFFFILPTCFFYLSIYWIPRWRPSIHTYYSEKMYKKGVKKKRRHYVFCASYSCTASSNFCLVSRMVDFRSTRAFRKADYRKGTKSWRKIILRQTNINTGKK
jgi:hypothetical protein